ncbi:MAG: tyrosine--tRNA ligase, partial [Proteobacteria bacterium]
LQLGGDDQWSNMLGGMELVRRKEHKQAFCATVPLLVSSAGKKMGKTENGAVWIDPTMTSPYDFYQYFRNIDDDMVEKCLFYFTDLDVSEVKRLAGLKDKEINDAKIELAWQVTNLIHGEDEANKAKAMASSLFAGGGAAPDAPEVLIDGSHIPGAAVNIVDLLTLSKLFPSKSEVRRMIEQGGLSLDGEKVESMTLSIDTDRLKSEAGILVKKGKKSFHVLRFKV